MNHLLKIIFTILISFCIQYIYAQPLLSKNFLTVDAFAIKMGRLDSLPMGTISAKLTKPFADKIDKARAIYTWITKNIVYDAKAVKLGKTDKNSSTEVLLYRKAVGLGFANLFQDMCSSANIRCLTTDGFVKNNTEQIGEKKPEINHTWAIVQLGLSPESWYYVDPAFGSGYFDNDLKVFTQSFNEGCFFADKTIFDWQHFPNNLAWKLSKTVKDKTEFYTLPIIKNAAYSVNLKSFSPKVGQVKCLLTQPLAFVFGIKSNATISKVQLVIGEVKKQKIKDINFSFSGSTLSFNYKFEKDGTYPLTVLIDGKELITYLIEVSDLN